MKIGKELYSTFILLISLGIAAIPATAILQFVSSDATFQPYSMYKETLGSIVYFIVEWFDVLFLAFLTFRLNKNVKYVKYNTQENIRRSLFVSEINRWKDTPYISPLMFYYLMNPPQAFSPWLSDNVENRFYQEVVNAFRDRVFINAQYTTPAPNKRMNIVKIIGLQSLLAVLLLLVSIGGYTGYMLLNYPLDTLINGWPKYTIPFLILAAAYTVMKIQAFVTTASWSNIDEMLIHYFQEIEPRITWRSCFQDQKGDIIIKAWQAECERRMRDTYLVRNKPLPFSPTEMVYDNKALPPYPFPSIDLPDWAQASEDDYYDKLNEWNTIESQKRVEAVRNGKGKVVNFHKKRS